MSSYHWLAITNYNIIINAFACPSDVTAFFQILLRKLASNACVNTHRPQGGKSPTGFPPCLLVEGGAPKPP